MNTRRETGICRLTNISERDSGLGQNIVHGQHGANLDGIQRLLLEDIGEIVSCDIVKDHLGVLVKVTRVVLDPNRGDGGQPAEGHRVVDVWSSVQAKHALVVNVDLFSREDVEELSAGAEEALDSRDGCLRTGDDQTDEIC